MRSVPYARRRMQERADKRIPLTYDFGRFAETEFLNYLIGKKVIIVGPAGYLQDQGMGEWIDSFDVIVRVNHAIPISYPKDYGSRTDVLYHILSHRNAGSGKRLVERDEVELWHASGLKWLVSRHDVFSKRIRYMSPVLNGLMPWICIRNRQFEAVRKAVKRSPNTGLVAISHLLTSKLHSLHVVGFDFYQSGVYTGYGDVMDNEDAKDVNGNYHDTDSQLDYMRTLDSRESRLVLDEHLKGILR